MKLICGDCQQTLELPESFFDGGAFEFWRLHGCFPDKATYVCQCGDSRITGLITGNDPVTQCHADQVWIEQHLHPPSHLGTPIGEPLGDRPVREMEINAGNEGERDV